MSPRTGRAVSRAGAGGWADRLLPLPPLLLGAAATLEGVVAALELTGFFLAERLAPSLGNRPLPPARARFAEAGAARHVAPGGDSSFAANGLRRPRGRLAGPPVRRAVTMA